MCWVTRGDRRPATVVCLHRDNVPNYPILLRGRDRKMSLRGCHGMARTLHPAPALTRRNPYTMTMVAVAGRDAVSTDRALGPPRFSRRWCARVVADFRRERARFGLRSTLREFTFRAIHHVVSFRVLRGIYLAAADARFTECPAGFTGGFLSRETLQRVSLDRRYDLPPEFVDDALGRGDACYGILDGEHVASYGWYTHAPTRINDELWLHFDRAYVYRYKGLTLEPYRGRRFHAITMARTLDAWRARGYRGILAYVEANNLSSLKSVYRLGYVTFGRVFILRILRRYFIFNSPGCKAFGFRVGAERRRTRLPARTLMPGSGLEPERDLSQRVLSPQRLPVSPAGRLPHPLSPSVVRSGPPPAAL